MKFYVPEVPAPAEELTKIIHQLPEVQLVHDPAHLDTHHANDPQRLLQHLEEQRKQDRKEPAT